MTNILINGLTAVHAGSNDTLTTSDTCLTPPCCIPTLFLFHKYIDCTNIILFKENPMSDNKDETKTKNIHSLQFSSAHYLNLSPIMTVTKVVNGEAQIIENEETHHSFQVHFHGTKVPYLKEGDQVSVVAMSNGIAVLDKIRAANELPHPQFTQQPDGSFSIDAKHGITLNTPKATISISAAGQICLNGIRIDFTDSQNPENPTH